MRILPPELVTPHMMPLRINYYRGESYSDDDQITIVYKDIDSGQKYIRDIKNPTIDIYIMKPELRNYTHMRDYVDISLCTKHTVSYKNRWYEAAKLLQEPDINKVKASPYLFNIDLPIETYYLIEFIKQYPSDRPKILSKGFIDIENDSIRTKTYRDYGTMIINAVTYINADTRDVYTLVLLKDDLPVYPEGHNMHETFKAYKTHFYNQVDYLKANVPEFIKLCHDTFDDRHGVMNYNLLMYDDEMKLLEDIWEIIRCTDNDFISAWNMPYDIQHLIERGKVYGKTTNEYVSDKRFSIQRPYFKEDDNPIVHKKRHVCDIPVIPSFIDDMKQYAGIRPFRVHPSLKLNNIAKNELKDEKFDFSEISDMEHLFYDDLEKFILYNIKDVLLLDALSLKNSDMEAVYSRMYQMFVQPMDAFTTSKVVWNSFINFMWNEGHVPGINRNRGNKTKRIIDYAKHLGNKVAIPNDSLDDEMDFDEYFMVMDDDNPDGDAKEEKFPGAYVMNTLHMQPTGVEILGKPAKFIHDNVADSDVTAEYPTAAEICNMSNETLVGRVYLEDADSIDIPIPEGFVFRGDDKEKYKMDKSNFVLEAYTEEDVFSFANRFLDLPSPDEVFDDLEDMLGH